MKRIILIISMGLGWGAAAYSTSIISAAQTVPLPESFLPEMVATPKVVGIWCAIAFLLYLLARRNFGLKSTVQINFALAILVTMLNVALIYFASPQKLPQLHPGFSKIVQESYFLFIAIAGALSVLWATFAKNIRTD